MEGGGEALVRAVLHRSFDLNQLGLEVGGEFHDAQEDDLEEWVSGGLMCGAKVRAKQFGCLGSFGYLLYYDRETGSGFL